MYYMQRDEEGRLVRVESHPFPEMTEQLPEGSAEIAVSAHEPGELTETMQQRALLDKSDLGMVRVLEDLIYLLIRKGTISITDLPEMAQVKLMNRAQARQGLGGLEQLLNNDNGIL